MSGTKIVVVVLVLIVVLFVVFVVWGAGVNNKQRRTTNVKDDQKKASANPNSMMVSLNKVLGPFAPKLKAAQMQPSLTTYDLAPGSVQAIKILEDSDHKFRQATFVVVPQACANLAYQTSQDDGGSGLSHQDSDNPSGSYKNDPDPQVTFTILDQGGTLTIKRPPLAPGLCRVLIK